MRELRSRSRTIYQPVERFISLLGESETFRGFNTTHMAPLVLGGFDHQIFEETDTEIIYLPHIAEKLFETYPERSQEAIDADTSPSGPVMICRTVSPSSTNVSGGGYDETTGLMQVFVDTDTSIACEWADRVYASVRADSDPLHER